MRCNGGCAQKRGCQRARGVAEKDRPEADGFREQPAEERTQSETEIIDAVKAAQDAAALIEAREVDARHFPRDDPNTFADAD